jgi:hypothetical protein
VQQRSERTHFTFNRAESDPLTLVREQDFFPIGTAKAHGALLFGIGIDLKSMVQYLFLYVHQVQNDCG